MATRRAPIRASCTFAALLLLAFAGPRLLPGQVICAALSAQASVAAQTPGLPRMEDTLRLQAALDACAAGQTVMLARSPGPGPSDFFAGPLRLPAEVTLQIAAGVALHAGSREPDTAMIEAAPGAAIEGPGVIEAQPQAAVSDLIRSTGSLRLTDLTLRAAPGIPVHHTTSESLFMEGVSIVSQAQPSGIQPLVLDLPDSPVSISNSTFAGSLPPDLGGKTTVTGVSLYTRRRCQLQTPSNCLDAELPAILSHLELSPKQVLAAIFTPAELATPTPAGLVDFALDGVVFASSVISRFAAWTAIPPLSPGLHTFSAVTRDGSIRVGGLQVSAPKPRLQSHSTTSLSTAVARFPFGTSAALQTSVTPATATGSITLTDTGQPLANLVLGGGVATFTSNSFAPGTHAILAAYSGDTADAPSQSPPLTLIVDPDSTNLRLSIPPVSAPYGSLSPLSVSISPRAATGLISLYDLAIPNVAIAQQPLSNGSASFPLTSLAIGSHTLSASYAGDINDAPSSSFSATTVVTLIPMAMTLQPIPGSASYGTAITLTALLAPPGAGGTITFTDSVSGTLAQMPAAATVSAITRNLAPGLHRLQASYSGDATHATATSLAASIDITLAPTSTTLATLPANLTAGTRLGLTASVLPSSATGAISFHDIASGVLGSSPISSGTATLNVSSLLPGIYSLTASYSGDANDQPSTSPPQTVIVSLHATQLQFAPLPATSSYGAPLTATITALPATATGAIVFSDSATVPGATVLGATVLGSAALAGGVASLSLPRLSLGSHNITAVYAGDSSNSPATAPGLSLNIVPGPTVTTLSLARDPTPSGAPVTVDILVSSPSNTPGGMVVLRSGTATLASGVLSSSSQGNAFQTFVLPTAGLSPGSYPLTAFYLGDTDDLPSNTSAANQSFTITPTPVLGTLSLPTNPIPAGEPVTAIATLSSSSVPTGSITFVANGSPVSTVSLDATGHASAVLPALPPGSWAIAATYTAIAPFTANLISPLILNVQVPYSLALAPDALSLAPGASGTTSLTLTPLSGFTGQVQIACLPAVSFIHCTTSAASLTVGSSNPQPVTINLTVGATTISRSHFPAPVTFLAALAPVLLLRPKRQRNLLHLALFCLCLYTTGCGAGYFDTILPGPYKVEVSASVPGFSASQPLTVNIP